MTVSTCTPKLCRAALNCALHCIGSDAKLLSIGEALQPVFASTPAPSEEQACAGCVPGVNVVKVTWDGEGQPSKTDVTSQYELTLSGECNLKSAEHEEL
jgi:hypothetical protein